MRSWFAIAMLVGCVEPLPAEEAEEDLADVDGKADSASLPLRFLPGELILPSRVVAHEVRAVYRTEEDLEAALAIDNPGVDFEREWAVFYAAGADNPGLVAEARARIDRVSLSSTGLTLKVTTALEQNGESCPDRRTRPFVLVAVPRPEDEPPYTRMYRADRVRDCGSALYYDGVPFTAAQAAGALRACNLATLDQLRAAEITGTQASILVDGRDWASLADVASTPYIGAATMTKLRTLGGSF